MSGSGSYLEAAKIVRDAGGQLVGRTRLQKIAYLSKLAGFEEPFDFEYRHYGPFSEDLAGSIEIAASLGFVKEEEHRAEWGGKYSIYRITDTTPPTTDPQRSAFVKALAKVDAIELELAATAAFLFAQEGIGSIFEGDPWEETARLKPDKAGQGRLKKARLAYEVLLTMSTPKELPKIA